MFSVCKVNHHDILTEWYLQYKGGQDCVTGATLVGLVGCLPERKITWSLVSQKSEFEP